MLDMVADTLRDTPLIEWWAMAVLPIIGSMSLTGIWKRDRQKRTRKKPENHETAFVATLFCTALSTTVYGLIGVHGWSHALGVGIMIGPASPLLWWIARAVAPERISLAMRGRRMPPRAPEIWTDEERARLHDSLYGDGDTTLEEQVRLMRERRRQERSQDD
jgi:hypothetical protein